MNVCGRRKALPPISGAENPMGKSTPTRQRSTAVCIREGEEERERERERERIPYERRVT